MGGKLRARLAVLRALFATAAARGMVVRPGRRGLEARKVTAVPESVVDRALAAFVSDERAAWWAVRGDGWTHGPA